MTKFATLHEQILLLQRRMRAVRVNTPFRFDAVTSNLLPAIAVRKTFYARELCDYLKMNAIQVSRLLARLENQGLITRARTEHDARFKLLELSTMGRSALRDIVAHDNALGIAGLRPLSSDGRDIVAAGLRDIANGLGAPIETPLEGEDWFVTEQKRAARALGMLGNDYLESSLDIATYQLCFSLYSSEEPLRFRELREILPFDPSFISREIDRLTQDGWVQKEQRQGDRKAVYVLMTRTGRERFAKVHAKTSAKLAQALSSSSPRALDTFLEASRAVTSRRCPSLVAPTPQIVKRCKRSSDYFLARSRMVEWLVARNQHHRLPAVLIADGSVCFLIESEKTVNGIILAEKISTSSIEISNIETSLAFELSRETWAEILEQLEHKEGYKSVTVTSGIMKFRNKLS